MRTKSRYLIASLVLFAACGDGSTPTGKTYTCGKTVADCTDAQCTNDQDQEIAAICANGTPNLRSGTCGDLTVVNLGGIDTDQTYYYDSSGTLVAYIASGASTGDSCIDGPASFDSCDLTKVDLEDACTGG